MKRLLPILSILITLTASAQHVVPRGLPSIDSRNWIYYKGPGGFILIDSAVMIKSSDTSMKPLYPAIKYWANGSADSTLWLWDMVKWTRVGTGGDFYYHIDQLTDTSFTIFTPAGRTDTVELVSIDATGDTNFIRNNYAYEETKNSFYDSSKIARLRMVNSSTPSNLIMERSSTTGGFKWRRTDANGATSNISSTGLTNGSITFSSPYTGTSGSGRSPIISVYDTSGTERWQINGQYLKNSLGASIEDNAFIPNRTSHPLMKYDDAIIYDRDGFFAISLGTQVATLWDSTISMPNLKYVGGGLTTTFDSVLVWEGRGDGDIRAASANNWIWNVDDFGAFGGSQQTGSFNLSGQGKVEGDFTTHGSLYVGSGNTLINWLTGAAVLNFTSISGGASQELTISVSGAADGDDVVVSPPNVSFDSGIIYTARVSSSGTVAVDAYNITGGSIDPPSGTFKVRCIK